MNLVETNVLYAQLIKNGYKYQAKLKKVYDGTVWRNNQRIGPVAFLSDNQKKCLVIFEADSGSQFQYLESESISETIALINNFKANFKHDSLADKTPLSFPNQNQNVSVFNDLVTKGARYAKSMRIVYDAVIITTENDKKLYYGPRALKALNGKSCLLQTYGKNLSNWRFVEGTESEIDIAITDFIANFKHNDLSIITIDNFSLDMSVYWDKEHQDTWQSAFDYFMWKPHPEYDGNATWDSENQTWYGGGLENMGSWSRAIQMGLQVVGDWAENYRPDKIRFSLSGASITGCVIRDAENNFHYTKNQVIETGTEISLDFDGKGDIEGILLFSNTGYLILHDIEFFVTTTPPPIPIITSPTATPPGSEVDINSTISLLCSEPDSDIYWKYQNDSAWNLYDAINNYPIINQTNLVIVFYSAKTNFESSAEQSETYTLTPPPTPENLGFGAGGFGDGGFGE